MSQPTPPKAELSVRRLIGLGLLTRFFVDTGVQLVFPFLPIIAAGLGISPPMMGRLVSARSLMGLFSPLFGLLMDRFGYRLVMRWGLIIAAAGLLVLGSSQGWPQALVGMLLMGLGTFSFAPALQAYLSNRLPYARRARGLGIVEYAWALAGIIGLLAAGQLITLTSWRTPFFLLAGALFFFSFVFQILPSAREQQGAAAAAPLPSLVTFLDLGANRRSGWAVLLAGGLIMFATWHTFLNYGTWLEQEYGLEAAALGQVAAAFGVADLIASVIVSLATDRLGKRRSVIGATGLGAVSFLLLPIFNQSFGLLMVGFLLARFCFEFTIVSNLALLSEQMPSQRGKLLTFGAAFGLIGTSLAGFTGPAAYATWGAWGVGSVSAVGMAGAFLLNFFIVRE